MCSVKTVLKNCRTADLLLGKRGKSRNHVARKDAVRRNRGYRTGEPVLC